MLENALLFSLIASAIAAPATPTPQWLEYPGAPRAPGAGKRVVLVAADQEYRSEEALPMLARVLSRRHGFSCAVLFSVNSEGLVDPTLPIRWQKKGVTHHIPGLAEFGKADLLVLFSRLVTLPPEEIAHVVRYVDSGKPIIAIRTANHGFLESFPYVVRGKRVRFGEDVLGGTFRSHHGNWHRDSTRGIVVEAAAGHPILRGVRDIWGPSDVYRTFPEGGSLPTGCTPLVMGQPLLGRGHDDPINPRKEALPIAWTKSWTTSSGKKARVFHVTMGSARDFQCADLRRLVTNAAYWCLHMEDRIDGKRSVEIPGEYHPHPSGFDYEKLGVVPRPPAFYR